MPDEIAQRLADIIDNAAESLFNALQCCYLIADENFYNVNVKDVFRIGLSNRTDPDCFRNLGFDLEKDKLGELGSEKFKEVLEIIRYCFATRIPFARRDAPECNIKDNQIRQMYDILEEYGFANPDGIVVESFKSVSWLARTKKPEPSSTRNGSGAGYTPTDTRPPLSTTAICSCSGARTLCSRCITRLLRKGSLRSSTSTVRHDRYYDKSRRDFVRGACGDIRLRGR